MFSSRLFPSVFDSSIRDPFQSSWNRSSIFEEDPFFNPNAGTRQQQQQQQQDVDMQEHKYEEPQQHSTLGKEKGTEKKATKETSTRPTHQQQQMQSHQPSSRYLSPWQGMDRDWLGGGFMDPMREMNSMMRRMDQLANRMWREESMEPTMSDINLPEGVDSSTYSVSSSSFSQTGADGKQISHSTRSEHRRVGDVLEESVQYTDSNGNTRTTSKRGLGRGQLQEVTIDRNAKGEERKVENLRGIKPEEVEQFQSKWKEAAQKYDLLGKTQQPSITSGQQQAQLKAPSTSEKHADKTHDVKSSKVSHANEPRSSV